MFAGTQCEIFCENSDFTEVIRPRVGQKLTSMYALSIQVLTISETNSLIAAHSFTKLQKSNMGALNGSIVYWFQKFIFIQTKGITLAYCLWVRVAPSFQRLLNSPVAQLQSAAPAELENLSSTFSPSWFLGLGHQWHCWMKQKCTQGSWAC